VTVALVSNLLVSFYEAHHFRVCSCSFDSRAIELVSAAEISSQPHLDSWYRTNEVTHRNSIRYFFPVSIAVTLNHADCPTTSSTSIRCAGGSIAST
jgi:hypothetical protein